jgi:hypothetical protein
LYLGQVDNARCWEYVICCWSPIFPGIILKEWQPEWIELSHHMDGIYSWQGLWPHMQESTLNDSPKGALPG